MWKVYSSYGVVSPQKRHLCSVCAAVLRNHDILVWIRIRGSMHLTNVSGSCYFHHWPTRRHQKLNFFIKKVFCTILFKVHLHNFSQIKSQKEVTKLVEIKVFLTILLNDRRIRIRIQEVQKHVDPVDPVSDPDPQHCCAGRLIAARMRNSPCFMMLTMKFKGLLPTVSCPHQNKRLCSVCEGQLIAARMRNNPICFMALTMWQASVWNVNFQ